MDLPKRGTGRSTEPLPIGKAPEEVITVRIVTRPVMTQEDANRVISEIQEWQEQIRWEIDHTPPGPERERKIDRLMAGHDRIEEIHRELGY